MYITYNNLFWKNMKYSTYTKTVHNKIVLLPEVMLFISLQSYISCTVGVEYVGYNMITLGITNVVFSVLVGIVVKHVPREAIIGIGSVLHLRYRNIVISSHLSKIFVLEIS